MLPIMRRFYTSLLVVVFMVSVFVYPVLGQPLEQVRLQHKSGVKALDSTLKRVAKPRLAATPSVSISGLGDALIGENFTFILSFRNTGSNPGYGPFIDLVFPSNGADGDYNRAVQDGVEFVRASTHGYTFSTSEETLAVEKFPDLAGPSGSSTCVNHPWARLGDGNYAQVCGPAGDTLISLRLPFGAFVPGQPAAEIEVEAKLSHLADLDVPLNIRFRGGCLYGNDSLDNWCCGDTPIFSHTSSNSGSWPPGPVTPKLVVFEKSYVGPDNVQDETSSGPNFIRQYVLTANIATGQTLTDFEVNDKLPDTEQFVSLDAGGTTPGYTITSTPGTTVPGGTLGLRYGSVSGSAAVEDIKLTFDFYIPRLNTGGGVIIDPVSGNDVTVENVAWATGIWTPQDSRDDVQDWASNPICVPGGVCAPLHTLGGKSIAIQKSVRNVTDSNPSPGDVLEYNLTIQISDYFAFGSLDVTDLLSDGQHVLSSFTPTLQISGNGYALATAAMGAANYDISCNYSGGPGAECTANDPAADDGTTRLVFRVSSEIITRGQNGRLIGGCVNPTGGLLAPCTPASSGDGPTTGSITFRTVIQDVFTNNYPSGDSSVDQGDKFDDTARINGNVLDNSSFTVNGLEDDDATASLTIRRNDLSKSVYAVNGATDPSLWYMTNGNIDLKPGDRVTYRLIYNLNTSDVEDLVLEDFLPLPVFFVSDPDADDNTAPKHDNGPVFVFDDTVGTTPPAIGHAQFGPTDTFRAYSGIVPTLSRDPARNSLLFTYGDYDNPANQSNIIDLLFTMTVSSEPFADRSFITNEVHETEGSTNTGSFTQDAVQMIILSQPALATTKGIIWTNSVSAVLDPLPTGPVNFLGPSVSPRWSGTINSSNLAANPINSDITGVRFGDIVSFAIVVENRGSSLAGAFDIVIRDVMPEIYGIPDSGLNLQIYYGNGTGPIETENDGVVTQSDCTGGACGPDNLANTPDDIFGRGIKLIDPVDSGVCQAYNPNLGNNVIVITYDLQIKNDLQVGTFTNTAHLVGYTGSSGGTNHVQGDEAWNLDTEDTAETSWVRVSQLPDTGFAPQRVTVLPAQPSDVVYSSMPGIWLEIPALHLVSPIVGVHGSASGWNLTWLSNQVGYLQGTTPPTVVGNTALTAHVYLADGTPGPFVNLDQLSWGQTIILHANGYRYLYEVRQNRLVWPGNLSVFREDGYAWLTLLTCKGYNEAQQTYQYRVAVRAILLKVEPE